MNTKSHIRNEKQKGAGQSRFAPFFVLRRPLLHAAAALFGGGEGLVLLTNHRDLHQRLQGDALVLGALYLSSPTMYEATMRWLRLPAVDVGPPPEALTRYLLRALYRPTPFGLFGLLSVGVVDTNTVISPVVQPQELRLVHQQSFASRSAELLQREAKSYLPNPTLFRKGQEFRAWASLNDETEHCAMVSCQIDAVTDELFSPANSGYLSAAEVVSRDLVDLVDAGLLVSRFTTPSVFHSGKGESTETMGLASDLDSLSVDRQDRVERYQAFDAVAPKGFRSNTKSSIYACGFTDSKFHDRPRLSATAARYVADTATHLVDCFARPNAALLQLQPAFSERYAYESTPLLHFLDSDLGDKFLQLTQAGASNSGTTAGDFDQYLLEHIARALGAGQHEVQLRWAEIAQKAPSTTAPTDLLVCPVFALVTDPCSPGRELMLWNGMEVRTGTALLCRFEGLDEALAAVTSNWRSENADLHDNDAVLAEVVYVPHLKHGDVLQRPTLTSHAIYLCGAAPEGGPKAITLQTLYLRLCNGSFELWCSSLGRRVRPTLSVPHYFQGLQHPVYRFLCALAEQEMAVARLPLPTVVTNLPACPRIVVDGVVHRAATWNVHLPLGSRERSDANALRALLESLGVPQKFSWGELDQVLPIDSSNDLQLRAFLDDLGSQKIVRITEVLPPLTNVGPHEFALPVRVSLKGVRKRPTAIALPITQHPVRVALGDEYVYLQLFASARQVDRLPLNLDRVLGGGLARRGLSWFYIKYSYPSAHLRLRVEVPAGQSRWQIIRKLIEGARKLREDALIDSFALAEFEPEVDRYGGLERWRWSVQYFVADTDLALRVQRWVDEEGVDEAHLLMAMSLSILHVGLDFGLSMSELAGMFPESAKDAASQVVRQSSGALFRQFRPSIDQICLGQPIECRHIRRIQEACEQRSKQTVAARMALRASLGPNEIAAWTHWLYRCHAHMSINRLCPAHLGNAEHVALSLAARIAASRQAR